MFYCGWESIGVPTKVLHTGAGHYLRASGFDTGLVERKRLQQSVMESVRNTIESSFYERNVSRNNLESTRIRLNVFIIWSPTTQ